METNEPNAFDLLCQLVPSPCKEWFEFYEQRVPTFRYYREHSDGLRGAVFLPIEEMTQSITYNLLSQAAFELDITDQYGLRRWGPTELPDEERHWDFKGEMMKGILLLAAARVNNIPTHPSLPTSLFHLLLRTRGADPASRAWYQLSRGGVTLCLCDPQGGDRFLLPPTSFVHASIQDGLRMAENIQFLQALAESEPAVELKRAYTERTYDRQDEQESEAK